jgi:hypothetical protein
MPPPSWVRAAPGIACPAASAGRLARTTPAAAGPSPASGPPFHAGGPAAGTARKPPTGTARPLVLATREKAERNAERMANAAPVDPQTAKAAGPM